MTVAHGQDANVNETQPLLRNTSDVEGQRDDGAPATPLPKVQFAVLCFLRVLDPLNFSQIFPYINTFIASLHLTDDPSKIGIYSGAVESVFAVFQLLSTFSWASISDTVGRRPVVLAGIAGLTITTVMLGFSKTFAGVLIARALAGMASGNGPVIPTIVAEITDSTNQTYAFPLLGVFWPLGQILGPLIGGVFSEAPKWAIFRGSRLLQEFHILMPCLVIAFLNFIGLGVSYLFLDETLETKKRGAAYDGQRKPAPTFGAKRLWAIPVINSLCTSSCVLSFMATAFDVVFVLYSYTPIERGGLNLTVEEIGYSLAIAGLTSTILMMFVTPVLLARFDHFNLYHFFMQCWPWTFLSMPILHVIAKNTQMHGSKTGPALWVGIAFVLAFSKVSCLAFALNTLLIKAVSPAPNALGTTMGLLSTAICVPRAFAPSVVSYAFSLSTEYNILGGYFWAVLMAVFSALALWPSHKVKTEGHLLLRK